MSKTVPTPPRGARLFAVDLDKGQWFYLNHANAWQAMPDPLLQKLREDISEAMSATARSWGHRFAKLLSMLGLDFGSGDETQWSILRDAHRTIRWDDDAMRAALQDKDWPPLK